MKIKEHKGNSWFEIFIAKENERFFGILIFLFGIVIVLLKYL
ncbi:hypothetical protein [Clostridium sp. ZBS15]|nr:hypothetical protein [Clostridium sp. ZBS15]